MRDICKLICVFFIPLFTKAQVPTATILSAVPVNCSGRNIFFSSQVSKPVGSTISYKWSVAVNRSARIVSRDDDSSVVCTFSLPGIYTLSLTVANGTLSFSTGYVLSVLRSATASFNASLTTSGYPNQLSLTNYSSNTLKSYWNYSGSNAIDSADYILKDYPSSGSYTVMLKALGKSGCNDSLSYSFRISDSSGVILPNIFTPNDDGVNDVFRPITKGITSMMVWVYNRYGVTIANWDRINGSWDGYNTSGLQCGSGEYFVVVEATGFNGKTYKQKGTLTLIR